MSANEKTTEAANVGAAMEVDVEKETARKKAHARYMRFYRSVTSGAPDMFGNNMSGRLAFGSGKKSPPEILKMGTAAVESSLVLKVLLVRTGLKWTMQDSKLLRSFCKSGWWFWDDKRLSF